MRVMPIRYVADVAASERFYAALGLAPDTTSRSGNWSELTGAGGLVALHALAAAANPHTAGDVELCLVTDEPLEAVARRLDEAGYAHEGIVDENFGRLLRTVDPDGVTVQVNEHDRSLYA